MTLIVTPKTKQQAKVVKAFLDTLSIVYEEENGEDRVVNVKKGKKKKAQILEDLSASVGFVKQYRAGKVKAKSINQLLDEL
jgi:hypothetical protein